jgi:phospholipid-binding lipoprotein MlaA
MLENSALRFPVLCLLLAILALAGCATNSTATREEGEPTGTESAADPWEQMNRRIFRFNRDVDRATLKPVAIGYEKVIPSFVRSGIRNFYTNLRGPRNILNNFLQGKGTSGFSETGRFVVNSTIGILGLVDVASGLGLEKHQEDFGQTLAVWGVPDGPYVMVPFAGPQTLRDAFAFPMDVLVDPLLYWLYDENAPVRYGLYALRAINFRAGFLSAEALLDQSFDPYVRLREAYLQNRRYDVYDGDPPVDDDFYDDIYDDLPEPDPAPEDETD